GRTITARRAVFPGAVFPLAVTRPDRPLGAFPAPAPVHPEPAALLPAAPGRLVLELVAPEEVPAIRPLVTPVAGPDTGTRIASVPIAPTRVVPPAVPAVRPALTGSTGVITPEPTVPGTLAPEPAIPGTVTSGTVTPEPTVPRTVTPGTVIPEPIGTPALIATETAALVVAPEIIPAGPTPAGTPAETPLVVTTVRAALTAGVVAAGTTAVGPEVVAGEVVSSGTAAVVAAGTVPEVVAARTAPRVVRTEGGTPATAGAAGASSTASITGRGASPVLHVDVSSMFSTSSGRNGASSGSSLMSFSPRRSRKYELVR